MLICPCYDKGYISERKVGYFSYKEIDRKCRFMLITVHYSNYDLKKHEKRVYCIYIYAQYTHLREGGVRLV